MLGCWEVGEGRGGEGYLEIGDWRLEMIHGWMYGEGVIRHVCSDR